MNKKNNEKKNMAALKDFASSILNAFQPDIDHCMQMAASHAVLSSQPDFTLIQKDILEYLTTKYGDTPLTGMLFNKILNDVKNKHFNA